MFILKDQELEELKKQVESLKAQNEQLQTAVTQQVSQIQQHKDQYNLLKVQLGITASRVLYVYILDSRTKVIARPKVQNWCKQVEQLWCFVS